MRFKIKFEQHAVLILTWGGLGGGLSVALALSLTTEMHRDEFVPITYMVVVFSILIQGLTIGKLAKKLLKPVTV
jgi:CPA1 family monovalent cation:H+ antiporter